MNNYEKIIPKLFYGADYENDVKDSIKIALETNIRKGKGLYLYGDCGIGKTHIACAIAKRMLELPIRVKFYNVNKFLDEMKKEFDNGIDHESRDVGIFEEAMRLNGLLILDDLGTEKATDWTRERFCTLINHRYEEMLPTIFTSNCDLEILHSRMGDRVVSRIVGMTEVINLTGTDKRLTPSS